MKGAWIVATDALAAHGLVVRAPTMDDAEAVTALCNVCAVAQIGVPAYTAAEMRQFWSLAGFDPRTDAFIVHTAGGEMVAYGDVWVRLPAASCDALGQVRPDFTGRGIGTHLLALLEARARAATAHMPAGTRPLMVSTVAATNAAAHRLLERHGYALVRHSRVMSLEMEGEPEPPRWPEGVTVRAAVAGQDERAVWEANQEAFRDHFDHHAMPFEDWVGFVASEGYDPSLWFLAMERDEIAGMALCRTGVPEYPGGGWVGSLSVRRPWRRRGLGMALLQHTFGEFARRGVRRVGLGVDASSLTGANRLYERAGMRVLRQQDRFEKALRAGADGDEGGGQRGG